MIIINTIILTGRLSKDPELKKGKTTYCRFSLAVSRPLKKDETDFINCVAFGKTAELIGEYVRKGHKLGLQGSLQMNTYESNGEKRTSYDVVVGSIEFLENKGNNQSNSSKKEVVSEDEFLFN